MLGLCEDVAVDEKCLTKLRQRVGSTAQTYSLIDALKLLLKAQFTVQILRFDLI